MPKKTKPLLKVERVVAKCIRAMVKGRRMCVTNWYTKMQHVMFKMLPDSILSRLWLGMLKHPEKENENGKA
jgi:short-subunit dehydrogenase